MLNGLAETKARIQDDLVRIYPGRLSHAHPLGQERTDLPAHIAVAGVDLHGVRLALNVHDAHWNVGPRRHLRRTVALQGAHIINQPGTELCGFLHDLRVAGVDRNHSIQLTGNGLHHRAHPIKLFLGRHLSRAGPGGFATHINERGTVGHHLPGANHRHLQRIEPAAVGKRIRSHIQDAHNMATGKVQFTASKVHFHKEGSRRSIFGSTKTNAARRPGGAFIYPGFGDESVLAGRATDSWLAPVVIRCFGLRRLLRLVGLHTASWATVTPVFGRTRLTARHAVVNLVAVDGLVLHQGLSHQIELVTILNQDLLGRGITLIDDVTDFLINTLSGFRRVMGVRLSRRAAQERLFAVGIVLKRPKLFRQAPLGNHVTGQTGGTFDVVRGTGGHTIKAQSQLFRNAATKQTANGAGQVTLGVTVLVFFRQEHSHTEGPAPGDDAHLVHRVVLGHQPANDGMARLVVRGVTLFFLIHHHGLALSAHHDLVFRQLKLFHGYQALVPARGKQGGLVYQVSQVGTGKTGSTTGNQGRVDTIGQRHLFHVHFQNLLATQDIRQANHHLAVKTTRAQQCRVQYVRAVGGGNHDNAFVTFKAVHFNQQLVQRLLTLIVTTTHASATVATNSIDLVDEDDAGALFLGLLEHVANPGGTHAHKHFHEVGTGDGEERHLGFTGNGLGEQGFTSTWRANHQDTLGNPATQSLELARITQEVHQLFDIFLGFVDTGDITKGGFDLIFTQQARLALTERHGAFAATAALHLAHEEDKRRDNDQNRERGHKQLCPQTLTLRFLTDHLHAVGQEIIHQFVVSNLRTNGLELGTVTADALYLKPIDGHLPDLALLDHFDKLRIINLLPAGGGREILKHHQQHSGYY